MTSLCLLILALITISVGSCSTPPSSEQSEASVGATSQNSRSGLLVARNKQDAYQYQDSYHVAVLPDSVECYSCIDCPEILPNTTSKLCPVAYGSRKSTCVTFAERYRQVYKTFYIRGCATERGSCAEISRTHSLHQPGVVYVEFCEECEGDKCNTSGVGRCSLSLVLITVLVFISKNIA